jgi:hypothetical protein
VVPVGHQHRAVMPGDLDAGVEVARGDGPAATLHRLDVGHRGAEGDRVAEAEVVDEVVEVPRHLEDAGVGRKSSGMGRLRYSDSFLDVLTCSDRYDEDMPLSLR